MGAPYIYDISRLRVKDLHSATYIYVVRRLKVNLQHYATDQDALEMMHITKNNTAIPDSI